MSHTKTKTINVTTWPQQGNQSVKVITITRHHFANHIETEAVIRYEQPPTLVQWLMRVWRRQ